MKINKPKITFLIENLSSVLFLFCLVTPTTYDGMKIILISIISVLAILVTIRSGKINIINELILLFLAFFIVGIFFTGLGFFRGHLGALDQAKVYVIYPLFFFLWITLLNKQRYYFSIHKLFLTATISICIFSSYYILWVIDFLPDFLYMDFDLGQNIGFYQGYIEFTSYSLPSFLFLVPYLFVIVIENKYQNLNLNKKVVWLTFLLSIFFSLISGRRMLILVIVFCPVIYIFIKMFILRSRIEKNLIINILFLVLVLLVFISLTFTFIDIDILSFVKYVKTSFRINQDPSMNIRLLQLNEIVKSWKDNPIFGTGYGAGVDGIIRDINQPWAFELSYFAILLHTGIFGISAYVLGLIWIYFNIFRLMKKYRYLSHQLLPITVGVTTFLLGNFTNPYLAKFGYLWIIFLPVAIINNFHIRKQ